MNFEPKYYYDFLTSALTTHLDDEKPGYKELRTRILGMHKALEESICLFPAGKSNHHWHRGGYVKHIAETVYNTIMLYHVEYIGKPDFDLWEAVLCGYLHDLDKLERFEFDKEAPTKAQLGYAKGLGINIAPDETKGSLSGKIDAAVNNLPVINKPFMMRRDYITLDEGAHVQMILARYGIALTLKHLEVICHHHLGFADQVVAKGNDVKPCMLTYYIGCCDMLSGSLKGKVEYPEATNQ